MPVTSVLKVIDGKTTGLNFLTPGVVFNAANQHLKRWNFM